MVTIALPLDPEEALLVAQVLMRDPRTSEIGIRLQEAALAVDPTARDGSIIAPTGLWEAFARELSLEGPLLERLTGKADAIPGLNWDGFPPNSDPEG